MTEIWLLIIQAFWFIAPAYAANSFPPLIKGRKPLDNGKKLGKHRLFGDGKTIEGTIAGVVFGIFIGLIQMYFQPMIPVEFGFIQMTINLIALLSVGAILGDIVGSFIKRRFGLKRGQPIFLLDQLNFLIGAFIFSSFVVMINLSWILLLIIFTPIVHYLANLIGYELRIKRVPY